MSNKLGILSGSLSVYGDVQLTGSLLGTASWAVSSSTSVTASYALMAETASYAIVSIQSITSSVTNDIIFQAKNNGTNIPAGTPVYISSSNGNNIIVERAQSLDQTQTFDLKNELAGVTQTDINGGQSGTVVAFGQVSGINMSAYNSGDKIWVSKTIGQLTNIAPSAPYDRTFVGIVTKNTTQGELFVNPSQPIHFHDISSVSSSLYHPGDLWVYQASASTGIWTNKKTLSGSYQITGSLNVPSITGSLLGTASHINVTGSNIEVNWDGSLLQLSGSKQFSVIVSETTPGTDLATGSLWWDSVTGILSVLYGDDDSVQWVEANYGGTMASASFASTASGMLMGNYSSNNFSDDAAAAAAGIPLGGVYRNGSFLQVRTS